jgi:hypothetical protein
MLKSLSVILLIIAMIGSTQSSYVVLMSYELNKRFIATNLCENRTKPALKCNGKCFLRKKLKETQDSEKDSSQKSDEKTFSFFSLELSTEFSFDIRPFKNALPDPIAYYNIVYYFKILSSIFRPPQVC